MNRVRASVTGTAMPTTRPLRQPMASAISATTESVASSRCWTSSLDFSSRRLAVVAGDRHVHVRWQQVRAQRRDLGERFLGEGGRVGAGTLGERHGDGRVLAGGQPLRPAGGAGRVEHRVAHLVGAVDDARHVARRRPAAPRAAPPRPLDVARVGESGARLHRRLEVGRHDCAGAARRRGRGEARR